MHNVSLIAVDTETTGLNPWTGDRPFGISMASPDDQTAWFEFMVGSGNRVVMYNADTNVHYHEVKTILEDDRIDKVFFNAPFDLRMLEFAGIMVQGNIDDLSMAIRVLGVDRAYWKLKPLCKHFFEISDDDEQILRKHTETLRRRAKGLGFALADDLEADYWLTQWAGYIMLNGLHQLKTYQTASKDKQTKLDNEAREQAKEMRDAVKNYGTLDAIRTITGWLFFKEELERKHLWDLYQEEMELLINTTYGMITTGIQTNPEAVRHGLTRARQQQAIARFRLNKTFWYGFNPQSVNDKRRYFIKYKKLQPLTYSKKTMEPSIDEAFLEYYAKSEPGAKAIIQYVAATKAKSTYFDWMVANHDEQWVLHPDLNQWGTLTGRFSGRFLTIPKRAKPGSIMLDVRRCLGPRRGCYWLLADYSQIEARIYADEFEEPTMLAAFANDEDVYVALQNSIIDNTRIDVGRQVAKNIFLGKIYGLGLDHLIEMIMEESHLDVDKDGAAEVVFAFDDTFPIVAESMKKTAKQVERNGFIRNRYGQIIAVPFDYAYKGVNYIIQSTAQRFIKRAMIRLTDWILQYCGVNPTKTLKMLLQIHDELIFECGEDINVKKLIKPIRSIMEEDEGLFPNVKLKVDFEICKTNWLEKQEL